MAHLAWSESRNLSSNSGDLGGRRRASRRLLLVVLSFVFLAGCATGPSYTEAKKSFPELTNDKGRIFFYRDGGLFGGGIQPSIRLNGDVVGDAVPGGFFFKDVKPGVYDVSVNTEVVRSTSVGLVASQSQYVKFEVGLGFVVYRIHPKLVSRHQGQREIRELVYTGGKKPAGSEADNY